MSGLFDDYEEEQRQARRDAQRRENLEEERNRRSFGGNSNSNPRAGCGDYTGKCGACGSSDLWDDCSAYGCNSCGMVRFTG